MTIAKIATHKEQMLARLLFQYKDRPNIAKILTVVAARYQGLEDARWQLLTERYIDTAVGVQLDVIGRLIQQERGTSANDAEYRLRLRARMRANQSSGTVEDILAVFAALLGGYDDLELAQYYPAALILSIIGEEPLTATEGALFAGFLADSRAAAIDAQFHYSTSPRSLTFACARSARLTQAFDNSTDTTLLVNSTEGWPLQGFIIFDQGRDGAQGTVRYLSKTPGSFEGCSVIEGPLGTYPLGELITGVSEVSSQIKSDFEGEPFPSSIELYNASAFPNSGAFCLNYGLSTRRIFLYGAKSGNELQGITQTSEGTETVFGADSLIVFVDRGFSSTEEDTIGGYLSSIIGA